jgi:uncharacterized membrane protein
VSDGLAAATIAAAVLCGLNGGVFFAFSSFVMPALGRLPPAQGIAAMQTVNRAAVTPAFMTALFGAAAACVALIVVSAVGWDGGHSPWIVAGAAVYVVGTILTTIVYNVPRNGALDRLDASGPEAAGYWRTYLREWTGMNHVRAAAGLGAAALLTVAVHVA